MTSTELAVRPRAAVTLDNEQIQFIANTEFVPQGLRGNVPAIMACIATGRALGIDDMSALRLIHLVNGRPTFSAELMVQIVRRAGHSITGESKAGSCTVVGTRKDNGDSITVTWTIEMAQRAGLANKATWKSYPEALLWARAASQLCRQLFADCFAGNTYTPEELDGDEPSHSSGGGPEADRAPGAPEPSVAQTSVLVAESASPPDDPAADVPFGDDYEAPILPAGSHKDKPPSAAMVKKLNVLVGKLRPDHLSTLHLYQSMGRIPDLDVEGATDAEGELHWSPLRDSLTFSEAMQLIDRLERYANDKLEGAA